MLIALVCSQATGDDVTQPKEKATQPVISTRASHNLSLLMQVAGRGKARPFGLIREQRIVDHLKLTEAQLSKLAILTDLPGINEFFDPNDFSKLGPEEAKEIFENARKSQSREFDDAEKKVVKLIGKKKYCLLYTSPSPRD